MDWNLWIVFAGVIAAQGCGGACAEYHYSNCPKDRCVEYCVPSACRYDDEGKETGCTDDCDGEGSCKELPK